MPLAKPSGIVTLLSDLELARAEPALGVLRGDILSAFDGARIVELAHGVDSIAHGAFCLREAFAAFPAGTVHLATFAPVVAPPGDEARVLLAEAAGHYFVLARPELLGGVLARHPDAELRWLDPARLPARTARWRRGALAAAELAAGRFWLSELGPAARPEEVLREPLELDEEDPGIAAARRMFNGDPNSGA
jgi:S-adenosylmethionine hydrolase